ncbi:MAG TPA: glycosyltransferase [Phycisphaerae bacterium]|nr:glycosyltransferase [Phycisphaerae bacterium]
MIGLETARTEARYAWDIVEGDHGFDRRVLFPHDDYLSLCQNAIHAAAGKVLRQIAPHVVVVCGWGGIPEARAAILWARTSGVAVVVGSDTTANSTPPGRIRKAFNKRMVSFCDAAFVAGTRSRDYLVGLGFDPDAIADGCDVVDNEYFARSSAVSPVPAVVAQRRPYWISVCRFIPEKNLLVALEAYAEYRKRVPTPWDWVLCGDGPLRAEILAARDRLGIERNVVLPGFLQYPDLPCYYGGAEAMWLPSTREPWGQVVNEAMACGLPVVVSGAAGCAADLVEEGGNGWRCDPSSPSEMAQTLVRMCMVPLAQRQAMGLRSRQIVAKWDLYRYAEGLWKAATVALDRSARRAKVVKVIDHLLLRYLISVARCASARLSRERIRP